MGYLTISAYVRRYKTHHRYFFLSGKQRIGAYALCVQHSPNCYGSLDFLSLESCPQQPRALITRFRESYSSVSTSPKKKKIEEIKERRVEFWQCIDAAFQ